MYKVGFPARWLISCDCDRSGERLEGSIDRRHRRRLRRTEISLIYILYNCVDHGPKTPRFVFAAQSQHHANFHVPTHHDRLQVLGTHLGTQYSTVWQWE